MTEYLALRAEPAATPAHRDHRRLWKQITLGLVLIGVGMAVRLWLYQQPVNSDDSQYYYISTFAPTDYAEMERESGRRIHTSLRIAFLTPLRAVTRILGPSAKAFYVDVYLYALLSGVAIFVFSSLVSRKRIAAVVTILWATSPVWIEVDTRLLPDNFGTALALLGVSAVLWGSRFKSATGKSDDPVSGKLIWLCGITGGILLWAAWSTRASFAAFGCAGLLIALLSGHRRKLVAATFTGIVFGLCLECLFFEVVYADPFTRLKLLAGYGDKLSGVSVFQGYTLTELLLRYPRLIAASSLPEFCLHVTGTLGACFWLIRWRDGHNLSKLLVWLFGYGVIAYACIGISPPMPLMREKLRYYAVASPLFYLASADLFRELFAVMGRAVQRWQSTARIPAWARGIVVPAARCGPVLTAVALVSLAAYGNLRFASAKSSLVRNGNTAFFQCAGAIQEHQQSKAASKSVYTDLRTIRVLRLVLPEAEGWTFQIFHEIDLAAMTNGYVVLSWQRLNANVYYDYQHAYFAHELNGFAESHPILFRHRHGAALTEVFVVGNEPRPRTVQDITTSAAVHWSFLPHGSKTSELVSGSLKLNGKGILHTHAGKPWNAPDSAPLAGGRLIGFRCSATADETAKIRGRLYYWRAGEKKSIQLYMGQSYVRTESTPIVFWTWLSEPAAAYRLALQNVDGVPIRIQDVKVNIYDSLPGDVLQQAGGAW